MAVSASESLCPLAASIPNIVNPEQKLIISSGIFNRPLRAPSTVNSIELLALIP